MNDNSETAIESYRSFLLLSEITGEEPLSQREISRRLGVAVGLVNSYLKNLVSKGFVRVKNYPSNRYAYLLTPQGVAEKSRLAYQHLSYFTNLYMVARQDYLKLFRSLEARGVRTVAFCGVDEVAEIAYLSMQEAGLELLAVLDDDAEGKMFFGKSVIAVSQGLSLGNNSIVITSIKRGDDLYSRLRIIGIGDNNILRT